MVKIAAGYTGESIAEYVDRVLCVITRDDISRLHALAMKADTTAKKPKAKRAGRGETPGS